MLRSRYWKLAIRAARYAVFATVGIGFVLALLGAPEWVQWAIVWIATALAVGAWGCVWPYTRALRRERVTRIPDLGDVARHFDSRAMSATIHDYTCSDCMGLGNCPNETTR